MESHKVLVAYFSHAGDNYAVGNIEKGNTKVIAEYIKAATNADELEKASALYHCLPSE